eukprot:TRINITY_DN70074_c0_g1_i1.p1 TRINITY_DN70074_c0_g1~~TRINITY_DN70074_c0_g1_i1.p1  ORF type:complete len:198 (+),score=11.74 TRINITY_DN70074_c0_g1_i1:51-644(+)
MFSRQDCVPPIRSFNDGLVGSAPSGAVSVRSPVSRGVDSSRPLSEKGGARNQRLPNCQNNVGAVSGSGADKCVGVDGRTTACTPRSKHNVLLMTGGEVSINHDWLCHENIMKRNVAKDRVAFALHRAPMTSDPSPRLSDLEARIPNEMKNGRSAARATHCWENHHNFVSDLTVGRRRDRMTQYAEAQLIQANVKFRK